MSEAETVLVKSEPVVAAETQPEASQDSKQVAEAPAVSGGEKTEGADPKVEGVPEAYTFVAPEGYALDPAVVEAFTPIAKELGLSNEKAQKLADFHASIVGKMAEQNAAQMQEVVGQWAKDAKADKEIGGVNFEKNATTAMKAVARFATPEMKALLNETGLGNHPEMIRFCLRVGSLISEDTLELSGKAASVKRDAADVLYGSPTV